MLEPAPPWGWVTLIITLIVAFAALIIGSYVAYAWFEGQPFALLAGWFFGGVLTIVFVLQTRRSPEDRAALHLSSGTTPLPFVLFISFGAALILDLVGLAVTGQFLPAPALLGANLITGGLISWLFAIGFLLIVQPAFEELVFRGVAFPLLRSRLGAWFGLIATAALSAVFHLLSYPADYSAAYGRDLGVANLWYMGLLPFFAALVFGITRAVTGSTRSAMVAHAAFGLFALLKIFAEG